MRVLLRSPAVSVACALLACGPASEDEPIAGAAGLPLPDVVMRDGFDPGEQALLRSLWIGSLPEAPAAPSNRYADDPRAARLGERLFFDTALSADATVACSTCHQPALWFTDGREKARGLADAGRHTPTVVAAAHSPWQFWDGRRDSLWAQALTPFETAAEMGRTRIEIVREVSARYAPAWRELFGETPDLGPSSGLPERAGPYGNAAAKAAWNALAPDTREAVNRAFANVGKAIAAYERTLVPGPSRFDRYVAWLLEGDGDEGAAILSAPEKAGLHLFLDVPRTRCLQCHNGPLLTNQGFHDVATSRLGPLPDFGRYLGAQQALADEFNCMGPYSDATPDACEELRFLDRREMASFSGAFKTPTLRGVASTAPYMHDGHFESLEAVIEHYRDPPAGSHELVALELRDEEAAQLAAFLRTLDAGPLEPPTR